MQRRAEQGAAIAVSIALWGGMGAHAQVTSTFNTFTEHQWTDADNWDNVPDVSEYPDNGNGGFFFSAIMPASTYADIGAESIDLDALTLGANSAIEAGAGGVITVSGGTTVDLSTSVASLRGAGGTFLANGPLTIFGSLNVKGAWNVTANGELLVGQSLKLDGAGTPRVTIFAGAIIEGDIGMDSNPSGSEDIAEVVNQGGSEMFFTVPNTSHSLVPTFTDNGGTITVLNGGSLTFQTAFAGSTQLVTLNSTTLRAIGSGASNQSSIHFNRNTRLNGTITVLNDLGFVEFFAGVHEFLGGASLVASGTDPSDRVMLTGAAEMIGTGTLNCATSCPFSLFGGKLGADDMGATTILNTGSFEWLYGEIRSLTNQNTTPGQVKTVATIGDRTVSGVFNNEGHFTQGHLVKIPMGGKITNGVGSSSIWQIDGGNMTGDGTFENLEGQVLKSVDNASVVSVSFTNMQGVVDISAGSIDFRSPADLNVADVLGGGGQWIVSGNGRLFFANGGRKINGIADSTEVVIDGPSAMAPVDSDTLTITGGRLRLLNGAMLATGAVTNTGTLENSGGSSVEADSLENQGSVVSDGDTSVSGDWTGAGTNDVQGGSVSVGGSVDSSGGGTWTVDPGAAVDVSGNFSASTTNIQGSLDVQGDLEFDPGEVEELNLGSDTTNGAVTANDVLVPMGTIQGNGSIGAASLDLDWATLSPGVDAEPCGVIDFTLSVGGSLDVTTLTILDVDATGAPGRGAIAADMLSFTGLITLAGTLEVRSQGGVQLDPGQSVTLISGDQLAGAFDQVNYPAGTYHRIEYSPTAVTLFGRCAADLAAPFASLDFSDIIAFLTAFGSGSPDADYAPPFGVFDFSDVIAFLTAFGDGCP
ncbi:MAG: GC-type dockerin domain-anchored protein [Phycisphaerales bacterium]